MSQIWVEDSLHGKSLVWMYNPFCRKKVEINIVGCFGFELGPTGPFFMEIFSFESVFSIL
jgi:hypothetical protein